MVAPWILWRYVLRDIALYAILGLGVVTLTLGVANLLQNLQHLVDNGVGFEAILRLTLIKFPSYLAFAVPTSLLFGVLLAFGRMSADGEIVAMRAAGVSVVRLLPPVLLLGALSVGSTGYILFDVEPQSHHQMRELYKDLIASEEIISPGVMRDVGGQTVYVSAHGDETCPLTGVIVADLRDQSRPMYIAARCASIAKAAAVQNGASSDEAGIGLQLVEGSVHFPPRADDAYRKIDFLRMHLEIDLSLFSRQPKRLRHHDFKELLELHAKLLRGEDTGLDRIPSVA
jgi:lipopolysaccharide export system permease protein